MLKKWGVLMKKNSFIEGTIVATLGIILVKIIGIIYVIPLNAIIGEQGGALYGYAYTLYLVFILFLFYFQKKNQISLIRNYFLLCIK